MPSIYELFQNNDLKSINDRLDIEDNTCFTIHDLYSAVQFNNINIVKRLLKLSQINLNISADQNYALRKAADNGNLEIVDLLLRFPEVKNNIASDKNDALKRAASGGHIHVVNRLLEYPAVVEIIDSRDNEALRIAVENNHLSVISRLLEFDAVKRNISRSFFMAAGNIEILRKLIELPIQISKYDLTNEKYAIYAALSCSLRHHDYTLFDKIIKLPGVINKETMKWAVTEGIHAIEQLMKFSEVNQNLSEYGAVGIIEAAFNGKQEIVNYFLTFSEIKNYDAVLFKALHASISGFYIRGHQNISVIVQFLGLVGDKINDYTLINNEEYGISIHNLPPAIVRTNNIEVLNMFIDIPWIKNYIEQYGEVMLIEAISHNCQQMFNRLLEIPAIINKLDSEGEIVLINAIRDERQEMFNRLLEIPAIVEKLNNSDEMCKSAILAAVEDNCDPGDIVFKLLAFSKVIENITHNDNEVLVNAAKYGKIEIVDKLLEIPAVIRSLTFDENVTLIEEAEGYDDYNQEETGWAQHQEIATKLLGFQKVKENTLANGNQYVLRILKEYGLL